MEKLDLYRPLLPVFRHGLHKKYDIEAHGIENIPQDKGLVFIANHVEMVDSPIIAMLISERTRRAVRIVTKLEYFTGKGITDMNPFQIMGMMALVRATGMIPIDRANADKEAFIQQGSQALRRKESVLLHGEGTRNQTGDGKIYRMKPGGAELAIANDAPVIPTGEVYTKYSNGRKTHVDIFFGEQLNPEDFLSNSTSERRQPLDLITATEMSVAQLTGMERSKKSAPVNKSRDLR